jgi:hypothetical protein
MVTANSDHGKTRITAITISYAPIIVLSSPRNVSRRN